MMVLARFWGGGGSKCRVCVCVCRLVMGSGGRERVTPYEFVSMEGCDG